MARLFRAGLRFLLSAIAVAAVTALLLLLVTLPLAAPAAAAQCGGDFSAFLAAFGREAQAQGISQRTIATAFAGVSQDQKVLAFDRRQKATFRHKNLEHYLRTRVTAGRVKRGGQMLKRHAGVFTRVERQFGVPGPIITAIWGMETDYGGFTGNLPTIRVLATMAHDCRRTELFQRELLAALTIVERGYLTSQEMRGAYAGELGQTQFLPSSYIKYAIDYYGDGRPNLIKSVPDVLASTANYLRGYGWQRGSPWREGSANFEVLREWNRALIYRQAIAVFADRLADKR
jgi:lytic murein transglycosylase